MVWDHEVAGSNPATPTTDKSWNSASCSWYCLRVLGALCNAMTTILTTIGRRCVSHVLHGSLDSQFPGALPSTTERPTKERSSVACLVTSKHGVHCGSRFLLHVWQGM